MRKIVVRVEIGREQLRWMLAALMVLSCSAELGSESLTLTTTYPAPFGVYTQLVTTGKANGNSLDTTFNRDGGNTILAPGGGRVGVGTTSPGATLDVSGSANVSGALAVSSAASIGSSLAVGGGASIGGGLTASGDLAVGGTGEVDGSLTAKSGIVVTGQSTLDGPIDAKNHPINSVANPTNSQDAATKAYVDAQIAQLQQEISALIGQGGGHQ